MKPRWLLSVVLGGTTALMAAEPAATPVLPTPTTSTTAAPTAATPTAATPATEATESVPEVVVVPTKITDPVEAAAEFVRRKDHVMAITLLDNLLQRRDLTKDVRARAMMLRALISLETGKTSEAIVRFSAWLEQFPDRPEVSQIYLLLGQSFREMQATYRAREAFYRTLTAAVSKAARSNSEDLSTPQLLKRAATWEIAETEYQSANWERAGNLFQRFRDQNPESIELCNTALYRQADCSYQLGNPSQASERYELALSVSPFHPFAPEAWLRLLSLYGESNEARKQIKALESFIWLVKNLHEEQAPYWQQRCASVLLEQLRSNPKQQADLLTQLNSTVSDSQWKSIFDYYAQLISRTESTIRLTSTQSPATDEGWTEWKAAFNQMQQKLETGIKEATTIPSPSVKP